MTRRLTGIGECMIEFSQAGDGLYRRAFAGDVVNTLYYARRAIGSDWVVRFHTGLGTDPDSRAMAAFLNGAGIETDTALRVADRRPGLYTIHLDGAERSFSYWRDRSAARCLASDAALLATALDDTAVAYLSGITLAILSPADLDVLLDALGDAAAAGATLAFDPNIRPVLWPDKDRMREVITRCAALARIVLPSHDDEAAQFGDASPRATAARYATRQDQVVIVKNGPGEVCVSADGQVRTLATAPIADPVDTTGAGDSFNGAFLAAYLTSSDLDGAIRAAQATAGEVIRHHGALI